MTAHENNTLVDVGDVSQVVLGIVFSGADPDGSDFPENFEFATDDEFPL